MHLHSRLELLCRLNTKVDDYLTKFGVKFRIYPGDIKWKSSGASMTPDEFLGKASPIKNPDQEALQKYDAMIKGKQEIEAPKLWVRRKPVGLKNHPHPSHYEVINHEGRHRAMAARSNGAKRIPVEIVALDEPRFPKRGKFIRKALKMPKHFSPQVS